MVSFASVAVFQGALFFLSKWGSKTSNPAAELTKWGPRSECGTTSCAFGFLLLAGVLSRVSTIPDPLVLSLFHGAERPYSPATYLADDSFPIFLLLR